MATPLDPYVRLKDAPALLGVNIESPLLREPAACDYLTVKRTTLWKLVSEGAIRPVRLGRSVRFPKRELDKWLAQQYEANGIDPSDLTAA